MDEYPFDAAAHQLQLEYQQWLEELARDEAARLEFDDWLASTYQPRTGTGTCHAHQK